MDGDPVVGIDLGTTYSCIAFYNGKQVEIIPDNYGDRIIPSYVYFDHQNGDVFIGKIAHDKSRNSFNGIKDAKRFIGRTYKNEFITTYSQRRQSDFRIVAHENKMAAFSIRVNEQEVLKLPEEVSAEILKYLIDMAKNRLMKDVRKAVISIPAYFTNAQRKATKRAAELAGLEIMKFITEPTAAAIYYLKDKGTSSKVLVFDWGGGTLDVSLIKVENQVFEVLAVYGNLLLGGRDIDDKLFSYFQVPLDKQGKYFNRRFLKECIRAKEVLSVMEKTNFTYEGADEFFFNITRQEFEDLMQDIFLEVYNIVEYALADSGWSVSDVDQVVLAGGSSRIPKVREILTEIFGEEKIKFDLNPDEAVAAGAAIQAYYIENSKIELENLRIYEVTPLSLGISLSSNTFTAIIEKNTRLPTSKSKVVTTLCNNQKSGAIVIYEGVRKNCELNNKLGEFEIHNLPNKRAGETKITVTFNLDEDGILNVNATENSTGVTNSLRITMSESGLDDRRIKFSKLDVEKQKYEDDVFEKFNSQRTILRTKCKQILYDLNRISNIPDRNFVQSACKNFLKLSSILDFTEIERLEGYFQTMYDKILVILKKYNMLEVRDK